MEYLVEIAVFLPPDLDPEEKKALIAREKQRGQELREDGTIVRIWRIPGRLANVGVWECPNATALHDAISSLPMFPYLEASVTPLATHPLEAEDSDLHR